MAQPTIAVSAIGASLIRQSPNSSQRPCVTPISPPYAPTSSPITNRLGSIRISARSVSRIAAMNVVVAMSPQTGVATPANGGPNTSSRASVSAGYSWASA
jgi:hypothetical protein